MKKIIGLELYRKHLGELDQLKTKVSDSRTENNEELAYNLVLIEENTKKIKKVEIIVYSLLCVSAGLVWFILTELKAIKYFWIYAVVALALVITFWVLKAVNNTILKNEIAKNEAEYNKENKIIKEYNNAQNKIFTIVVFIICINDYLPALLCKNDTEIDAFWQKITQKQVESINKSNGFAINVEGYQNYFENWLKKKGYYE